MRQLALLAALLMMAAPAARAACQCAGDPALADRVLADPAYSVVDVTVRGYNTANGQSMLQIGNLRHGGLVARDIRAGFGGACAVVPSQKQMTLLIHNDDDGRYTIAGKCERDAVLQKLGR